MKLIKFLDFIKKTTKLEKKIDEILISNGKILQNNNSNNSIEIFKDINLSEFKVFSQHGDDGIISFLTNYLDIKNKLFVEFGVENYRESNTRYLLIDKYWKGLIIDSNIDNINFIKRDEIYWKYDLTAVCDFVTVENINNTLSKNNFIGEIGLLHIDIDGNDYWIWKNINIIEPIIVIVEYNSLFGNKNKWTIPYDSEFERTKKHYSNLYYGASLGAFYDLAIEKGYCFVGCNKAGNNAYFIKKGFEKDLKIYDLESGFKASSFRESRDNKNNLNFLNKEEQFFKISGLPIFNTENNKIEFIQ